jgi:hypothetical protein
VSTIIRISEDAKAKIAAIAKVTGLTMTDVVDDAIDALERRRFMEAFNRRYAELRDDPQAWAEIEAERREWDATLRDGLD